MDERQDDQQRFDTHGSRQNTARSDEEFEQRRATKAPNSAEEGSILEDDPAWKARRTRSGGEASGE